VAPIDAIQLGIVQLLLTRFHLLVIKTLFANKINIFRRGDVMRVDVISV
jgi:hypothetical protein